MTWLGYRLFSEGYLIVNVCVEAPEVTPIGDTLGLIGTLEGDNPKVIPKDY
jgi:hypothetical protein